MTGVPTGGGGIMNVLLDVIGADKTGAIDVIGMIGGNERGLTIDCQTFAFTASWEL